MDSAPVTRSFVFDSVCFERRSRRVLKSVFLRVAPGRICGLYGLAGSGRSTLLKVGAGQLRPSGGNVFVDGVPCRSVMGRSPDGVAYLSQRSFLPKDIGVWEVLRAFPIDSEAVDSDDILSRIREQRVRSISSGERRYLEVRLVLSLDRRYILLDEPFAGVEPLLIERMTRLIVEHVRRGSGVLLTDQYYNYVLALADDSYLISNGQCSHLSAQHVRRQLHSGGYL